jgi:bifunctional NMN adenylyltransferase/nudix hydrolase
MVIKTDFNPKDFDVAVLIARLQVDQLHTGHKELIDHIQSLHKKVILFLGVPRVEGTRRNPLDFAMRKMMVQSEYPNIVILPIVDQRSNEIWSNNLDSMIPTVYGSKKTILYGSRDSFIPYYSGKYKTIELQPSVDYNGTNIREELSKEIIDSPLFRIGVIHQAYSQRPCTFPTVDICVFNDKGEILMAKKPNEALWRFVGGFVDTDDTSYEIAAEREFREETGGNCSVGEMTYITSQKIDDWRYRKETSGIMTTLFLAEYGFGMVSASDDIVDLKWIDFNNFSNYDGIRTNVMPEHRELMSTLVDKVYKYNLLPNIGKRLVERTNVTYINE